MNFSINEVISDKGVFRIALATPGLLINPAALTVEAVSGLLGR